MTSPSTTDFDAYYLHIGDKPVVGPKNGYTEKDIGMINKTVEATKDREYVKAGKYKDTFNPKKEYPLGQEGEEQWIQK